MISRERASAIAHGDRRQHHPIGSEPIETIIGLLPLAAGERVLDVGCGRGELLLRIAELTGASGFGVDLAEDQIAIARAEAEARIPDGRVRFEALDARRLAEPEGSLALAACVGSTHALGGLQTTLERLVPLIRPDGCLLVGEGFWAQKPSADLLRTLGDAAEEELTSYAELLAAGEPHGLQPVYATRATAQDWDGYEWADVLNADRYAREHADEEGVELLRDRVEFGRRRRLLAAAQGEALGFALVVWRRLPDAERHPAARALGNP